MLSTITYKIMINKHPFNTIISKRGLRWGGLIQKNKIKVKLPSISHLIYAGNTILLCKVTPREAHKLKHIIQNYNYIKKKLNLISLLATSAPISTTNMLNYFKRFRNL